MTISTTFAVNTHTQLAACRLSTNPDLDQSQISQYVYYNGENNDGNGATITLRSANFLVDGVVVNKYDRILIILSGQVPSLMNGIYVCTQRFSDGFSSSILTRAGDLQNISQCLPGSYGFVTNGLRNYGMGFVLYEPVPSGIGLAPINIVPSPQKEFVPSSERLLSSVDITLTSSSATYNFITASVNINVFLPSSPLRGDYFVIKNIGGNTLTVKNAAAVTIGSTLGPTLSAQYFFDGTAWQQLYLG